MKTLFLLVTVGVALTVATDFAHAQTCKSYVGNNIETVTFDAVYALVSKVPAEKDEFETTEIFNKKISAISTDWPEKFFIAYDFSEHGKRELEYNADDQQMTVGNSAFDGYDKDALLYAGRKFTNLNDMSLRSYERLDIGFFNLQFIVSSKITPAGQYEASTASGATAVVAESKQSTQIVFERKVEYDENRFIGAESYLSDVGKVTMSPDVARMFKKSGKVSLLIIPKPPYFASGKRRHSPTLHTPLDTTERISVIVADVRCAFLVDGKNTVLEAFEIR